MNDRFHTCLVANLHNHKAHPFLITFELLPSPKICGKRVSVSRSEDKIPPAQSCWAFDLPKAAWYVSRRNGGVVYRLGYQQLSGRSVSYNQGGIVYIPVLSYAPLM